MIATVKSVNPLEVIVRRGYRSERIWESNKIPDMLVIGDKIEVKRIANNPYLIYRKKI
jgi:hypothetical protein